MRESHMLHVRQTKGNTIFIKLKSGVKVSFAKEKSGKKFGLPSLDSLLARIPESFDDLAKTPILIVREDERTFKIIFDMEIVNFLEAIRELFEFNEHVERAWRIKN